jgi:hypothetical protein
MKAYCFLLFAFFVAGTAHAQSDSTSSIVIHKDPRLDLLVKKQAQINEETTRNARRNVPGYRLQVINTSDRNAAISAKTKIYQLYPDLKAYLYYQAPYFRLRVGNFKEPEDADSYRKSLSKQFPNGVFLVRDTIEVRPDHPDFNQ